MYTRALSSVALAMAALGMAACGGSSPSKRTVDTTASTAAATTSTTNSTSTNTYLTVTEPDGFKFGLRVGQPPVLSAVQGDGSDSNYPAAPPGQDWVLVTLNVRNDQSDRPAQLTDLLAPTGALLFSVGLGIALPVAQTPQVKGQCILPQELPTSAPGGYCYLQANINFSDGSFYDPSLGGAPQVSAGGETTLNLYAGPVVSGTSLSGVKVWNWNQSAWMLVPTP